MILRIMIILVFSQTVFSLKAQQFFSTPSMSYVHRPDEKIIDTSFVNKNIAEVQAVVNSMRKNNPGALIRLKLSGTYLINEAPFELSSKMMLMLDGATFKAASNAKASSLINIRAGNLIAIEGSGNVLLDGDGQDIIGIQVQDAGKVHIDQVTIKQCNNGGIVYKGNGNEVYADNGSLTRSTIENCKMVGLDFSNVFNFICSDNLIRNCGTAVEMNGKNASVTNNTVASCKTGIVAFLSNGAIAYNSVSGCDTAVILHAGSTETLVAYNAVLSNKLGFLAHGKKAHIYNNTCQNEIEAEGSGELNQLYSNRGITPVEGSGDAFIYFNPPLIGNNHRQQIKIGKGRLDIVFSNPSSLLDIRAKLDSAHVDNPNTVLVAKINGVIKSTTGKQDSLLVKEDECFLMNGGIENDDSTNTLVLFADKSIVSFSGGFINGKSANGKKALLYITGQASVILDSITILDAKAEGITKRNSMVPTYIRACTVTNAKRRGIWQLAASRLFAFENQVFKCGMDGFDLDAYSSYSVLMNNSSIENTRHGIFVEEGANNHQLVNNYLSKNNGGPSSSGISFFNKEVDNKHTSLNLAAFNLCTLNSRGIMLNAASVDKSTENNTVFNNICINNADVGIGGFYNKTNTRNNYTAYNTVLNNINGSFYFQADYDSNTVWNMLHPEKMASLKKATSIAPRFENGKLVLEWNISPLSTLSHFEVFYGDKPYRMYKIGEVPGDGENQQSLQHLFMDTTTAVGTSYYFTKVVDKSGGFLLSPTIKVVNEGNSLIRFNITKPGPDQVKIDMRAPLKVSEIDFALFDLKGNPILSSIHKTINDKEYVETFSTSPYSNGLYLFKATTPLGPISQKVYLFK